VQISGTGSNLTKPTFKNKARRFLRWRKKQRRNPRQFESPFK
jgi:hypothetical protein